jgi:hypothetical protein
MVSNSKLCNLIITYLRNLFLKKINVIFLSKGTYITIAQSINQGHIYVPRAVQREAQIKKIKNLHVYYEKDNLCYLLKLLNNI